MSLRHLENLQFVIISLRHFVTYHHDLVSAAVLSALAEHPPERAHDYTAIAQRLAQLSETELQALLQALKQALPRHYGPLTAGELRDELKKFGSAEDTPDPSPPPFGSNISQGLD